MKNAVTVTNLTKTYKSERKQPGLMGALRGLVHRETIEIPAVKDISFTIPEGELVAFIGPNGAGKTTTLKMLSGILWPTSGEAKVLGHTPWKREADFQRQFGIVLGAKNQLWWDLPARDTFALNKEIYEIDEKQFSKRVDELAGVLGVQNHLDIPVRKLSLGERMKCELVNALLHKPKILLLDEPTIGLDVISQKAIRDFLKEWNKREGTTMMLTSHAMADVEALCERVIMIHSGAIGYDGPLAELSKRMSGHKQITVVFETPVKKDALTKFGEVLKCADSTATLRIPHADVRDVAKSLLDAFPVADLLIEETPLEDVVRDLFEKG